MKLKKISSLMLLCILLVCAICIPQIQNLSSVSKPSNAINIGVILPLTGALSTEGKRMEAALDYALKQNPLIQEKSIQFLIADGKFTIKDTINAFYNLKNNHHIDAWIIFGDTPLMGIRDRLNDLKVPTICLIGDPQLIKDDEWLFHFSGSIITPAQKIAQYAINKGSKNASVLHLKEQIGDIVAHNFCQEFQKKKGIIKSQETYNLTQPEVRSIIAKTLKEEPDAIFIYGYGQGYVSVINELINQKYTGLILSDGNFAAEKEGFINGGSGCFYADFDFGDGCNNIESKKFIQALKKDYNVQASSFTAFAYEAARILTSSIIQHGSDPAKIREALITTKDYPSIFGNISYSPNRELLSPVVIKQAQLNGAILVQP